MDKERVIIHSDINHCYAQIEEMKYPLLRNVAMAVGGHEEERHGIILAKNDLAKQYQIRTGESLREAYAKCPKLCIIHPHYEEYIYYTEKVKDIYREYSDKVESYGLDEAWIDVSESISLFGSGYDIAKVIQQRVYEEVGLTISMGISYNKIFAKLGSDMDKHMGLTCIDRNNYKEKVWPLPVGDLFYVGRATQKKLAACGIETIGDLAKQRMGWIKTHFGKMGELIWLFANGEDVSQVAYSYQKDPVKSIGNAITAPKDITNFEEAKLIYYVLAESVAGRLKEQGLKGNVITISLRNSELKSFTRQCKLSYASNLVHDIMPPVLHLLKKHYDFKIPLRTIGVSVSGIETESRYHQLNFFISEEKQDKQKKLEETMDQIRQKFGFAKARRCAMLLDEKLTGFHPKEEHIIHPESFF